MNCDEVRGRLEDYAHGELSVAEQSELEAHLERCVSCTVYLEQLEPSPAALATLPHAVFPRQDLWPGIQARLRGRGAGRRRVALPAWALAAAALLLIAISSAVTTMLLRTRPAVLATPALPVSPLEAQYASAAAELSGELERARSRLAPATFAVIERNLAVIDSALAETRRALAQDPGNSALERLVITAWQQKMDFLRRATALSTES